MHARKRQGFTLLDLFAMVAVIGMLSCVVAWTMGLTQPPKQFRHATASQVLSIGKSLPASERKDFAFCVSSQEGDLYTGHVYLSQVQACAAKVHDIAHDDTSARAINHALAGLTASSPPPHPASAGGVASARIGARGL